MDLNLGIISEVEKKLKKKLLIDYMYANLKHHNFWAYRYFFCELLTLINIGGELCCQWIMRSEHVMYTISFSKHCLSHPTFYLISGQMILLDRFFDGTFFTYGIEVMSFADRDQEDRIDPMIYVFPRMTKCTFHKFGTSGNIEKHDALCILPLNIVNEKIYIFVWFWLLILGMLTFLVLVYRVAIIFSPYIRAFVLHLRYRRIKKECIDMVIGKSYVGDWFLIYLLGQNIDSVIFKDVMHELAKKLGYRSRDIGET